MFSLIMCMGTWPGPSFITCTPNFPGAPRQTALRLEFGELRLVVGVRDGPGAQTVADGKAHVIRRHDLANVVPMGVEEIFPVVRQAPFGEDRARHG